MHNVSIPVCLKSLSANINDDIFLVGPNVMRFLNIYIIFISVFTFAIKGIFDIKLC